MCIGGIGASRSGEDAAPQRNDGATEEFLAVRFLLRQGRLPASITSAYGSRVAGSSRTGAPPPTGHRRAAAGHRDRGKERPGAGLPAGAGDISDAGWAEWARGFD